MTKKKPPYDYEWAPWHDCEHIELKTFRHDHRSLIKHIVAQGWEFVGGTQQLDGPDKGMRRLHFKRALDPSLKETPPPAEIVTLKPSRAGTRALKPDGE